MIGGGTPWGEPVSGPPDLEVRGGDADLAAVVAAHPGALVHFAPDHGSDLARAVGLAIGSAPRGSALPIDALELPDGRCAVNMVVLGRAPGQLRWTTRPASMRVVVDGRDLYAGRATTVVVASGQFLDGCDVVPRGHPGDGRLEVHVYAMRRGERRVMRARLPRGVHVPHPRIITTTGHRVDVHVQRGAPALAIDGAPTGTTRRLTVTVRPSALRLLV